MENNEVQINEVNEVSKVNKVTTGICLGGAIVGIGHALWDAGKWVYRKFKKEKPEEVEDEYEVVVDE